MFWLRSYCCCCCCCLWLLGEWSLLALSLSGRGRCSGVNGSGSAGDCGCCCWRAGTREILYLSVIVTYKARVAVATSAVTL